MTNDVRLFFSCIITCYNRERYIGRAIDSILAQSFKNFEIIVVDDASSDNSVKVVEAYCKTHNVKLIRHDKNSGQNAALNTGLQHISYEIVAFLDSDDEWHPDFLKKIAECYEKNPAIGFAYVDLFNSVPLIQGKNVYAETLHRGFLSAMIAITARKQAIDHISGFDQRYTICQDEDFCFRLAKHYACAAVAEPLATIHNSENSMTNDQTAFIKGWIFLFKNYKSEILRVCGPRTYARHLFKIAALSIRNGNFLSAYQNYFKGVAYYMSTSKDKFPFSLKEFLQTFRYIMGLTFLKVSGKYK